jgi:hypothetical protein|tara:strand:+ start:544 stop:744 length:201 start_codon:yes stop_codon:yes gene_type:complete
MINFILTITVLLVWVGAVYLYFLFDRLLDDIRAINDDMQECKAMMKIKMEQDKIKAEVPNDEFLGI